MKVEIHGTFNPITIKFETQEEVDAITALADAFIVDDHHLSSRDSIIIKFKSLISGRS
jgi:hypothetical protein